MRITLMHNPMAGERKHEKKQLMAALAEAGHQATYESTNERGFTKTLKHSTDLVLAAGGDGTVAEVACRLIDSGIPLSVLPLGTANNLARSLGFVASAEEIIDKIESGKRRTFDVGVARGPWGTRLFFESAGGGLLAEHVRAAKGKSKAPSKELEIARHVSLLRRTLETYPRQKWQMEIDGETASGDYILWEAMNVRSVGPVLYLASKAATRDGRLDFVCVRDSDRPILTAYLNARLTRHQSRFPFPIRRLRQLKIFWEKSLIHFDDEVWPRQKQKPNRPAEIEITVKPSALLILQPAGSAAG